MKKFGFIIKNIGKRLVAFIICLACILSVFDFVVPSEVVADDTTDTGVAVSDTYILQIDMGSDTSPNIQFFTVKYLSTNGIQYFEYIFIDNEYSNDGFTDGSSASTEKESAQTTYIKNLGFKFESVESNGSSELAAEQTTQYIFKTQFPTKEILEINLFTKYSTDDSSTGIQGISIYKVSKLYGRRLTQGTYGTFCYIFDGELVGYVASKTYSWTSDHYFRFTTDKNAENRFITSKEELEKRGDYKVTAKTSVKTYILQIDIADIYKAGIEGMITPVSKNDGDKMIKNNKNGWLFECLTLGLTYKTYSGATISVNIPLITSSIYYAVKNNKGLDSAKLVGYMQQGTSLVCEIGLPNCTEIVKTGVNIAYGVDSAKTLTGVSLTNQSTLKKTVEGDPIRITGVYFYEKDEVNVVTDYSTGTIVTSVYGTPTLYYVCSNKKGDEIGNLSEFAVPLSVYKVGSVVKYKSSGDLFLIKIKTDTPAKASTTENVTFKFGYKTIIGEDVETSAYSAIDLVREYYGYWPSYSGTDYSYVQGMSCGGSICMLVNATDLNYFTYMTVSMDKTAKDDWQFTDIGIYEITTLGARSVTWDYTNSYTDRIFSRDSKLIDISPTGNNIVLISPGDEKKIEFSGTGSTIADNDIDWNSMKYSMTYTQAMQNLDFTKKREEYAVKVCVSGATVNGQKNEDNGSKENFFFQLIFKDGVSAYVLANQQLTADGFQSGVDTTFYITTNQDYGDLVAIRIIPDSVDPESTEFDKMLLDTIEVSKKSETGLSMTWSIEVGGWITKEYSDPGAKTSIGGQQAKKEAELANLYYVTTSGYSVDILFELKTKGFKDGAAGETDSGKPKGTITATINYEIITGDTKSEKVNLIDAIYKYDQKTSSTTTYKNANGQELSATKIDFGLMLRAEHTDRFYATLSNVRKINKVTLSISSMSVGRWMISGIDAYLVTSAGTLRLNINDEYQSTQDVEKIASSNSDNGYDIFYPLNGAPQDQVISFRDNEVNIDLTGSWKSTITRTPDNEDDTINIYAYVEHTDGKISEAACKATVTYATGHGAKSVTTKMTPIEANAMYYSMGVKVSGMTQLGQMKFTPDSFEVINVYLSHVVVEHLKSGVVVETIYYDFSGANSNNQNNNIQNSCSSKPSQAPADTYEKQMLSFMISSDSYSAELDVETSDVAVAISYISKNDPTRQTQVSPYIFLTDLEIEEILAGDVITVEFEQSYVKDVIGVTFLATGEASGMLKIECSYVDTYKYKSGDYVYANRYSFGNPMTSALTISPMTAKVTASTSDTLTISGTKKTVGNVLINVFTAQNSSQNGESGTRYPLKMTISYFDDNGMSQDVDYTDARVFLKVGSFNTGDTATLELLLPGFESLRYVYFEPYDLHSATSSRSWTLEKLSAIVNNGTPGEDGELEQLIVRTINKTIVEGEGIQIGLADIEIKVTSYTPTASGGNSRNVFISTKKGEESEGLLVETGKKVTFVPVINGSLSGLSVKCEKIDSSLDGTLVKSAADSMIAVSNTGDDIASVIFDANATGTYRLTFISNEITTVTCEIVISVVAPAAE